jgi:hypothetical protein
VHAVRPWPREACPRSVGAWVHVRHRRSLCACRGRCFVEPHRTSMFCTCCVVGSDRAETCGSIGGTLGSRRMRTECNVPVHHKVRTLYREATGLQPTPITNEPDRTTPHRGALTRERREQRTRSPHATRRPSRADTGPFDGFCGSLRPVNHKYQPQACSHNPVAIDSARPRHKRSQ